MADQPEQVTGALLKPSLEEAARKAALARQAAQEAAKQLYQGPSTSPAPPGPPGPP